MDGLAGQISGGPDIMNAGTTDRRNNGSNGMRPNSARFCLAAALALALSACSHRGEVPSSSLGEDDDTFCRANNVKVGSPEYVACRKDRDVQHANAAGSADRSQRDLAEFMLNNPTRP